MSATLRAFRTPVPGTVLIEGYASLFGVPDASGDVVRAGAFAKSLRSGGVPMLLQHKSGSIAGQWRRIVEDGRGLFVRGLVESQGAKALVKSAGLDGLSIGFRPRIWVPRSGSGRTLIDVDLVEISLVSEPMLASAKFKMV